MKEMIALQCSINSQPQSRASIDSNSMHVDSESGQESEEIGISVDSENESDAATQRENASSIVYYAPDDAKIYFEENNAYIVVYNNIVIRPTEIKLIDCNVKPWSFSVQKGINPTKHLQTLINASSSDLNHRSSSMNWSTMFQNAQPLFG